MAYVPFFPVKGNIGFWPIVLTKADGKLYGQFSMASTVQLASVRAVAAVLDSRVTDVSFPADIRHSFQHSRPVTDGNKAQCTRLLQSEQLVGFVRHY